MVYPFPPDVEKAIQELLQTGEFANEIDVLRDALKALDEQRRVTVNEDPIVVEGVRRGLEDMRAGRSQPLEDFDREFRAKHRILDNV